MDLETVILSEVCQRQMHDINYMFNVKKKKRHKWTYLQDRNGVYTYGYQEERGGKLGDWDWHTHTATAAYSLQLCLTVWPYGLQPIRLLLSMEFSRQEYWSGLPFLSQRSSWARDQTHVSCISGGFFTSWATRKSLRVGYHSLNFQYLSGNRVARKPRNLAGVSRLSHDAGLNLPHVIVTST